MAGDLFVAVWGVRSGVTTLNIKLYDLWVAADKAWSSMSSAAAVMKVKKPIFVFVAPEYYFIPSFSKLYDGTEAAKISIGLTSLSKKMKNLIMIPGTVNFQIPVEKAVERGWNIPNSKGKKFSALGLSYVPVLLDGTRLLGYYKKFNDGIIDKGIENTVYKPGDGAAKQTFDARDLTFGIDVCGDINDGQLNKTLGGRKVDVEALISGTVTHEFTDAAIDKVPVRDGGAFIHCDTTGKAEKNGVWVLNRGQGWHGTRGHYDEELTFLDLDGYTRTIVFATEGKGQTYNQGDTMKVIVHGFGNPETLDATINRTRGDRAKIMQFSLVIKTKPGKASQKVDVNGKGGHYNITLTRNATFGASRTVNNLTSSGADRFGMKATGGGNVSKIGKLLPGPQGDQHLNAYHLPI